MVETLRKPPTRKITPPDPNGEVTVTFRLRRHGMGNFKGLWELATVDQKGKVIEIISDADALLYCLDNLHGILEDAGL